MAVYKQTKKKPKQLAEQPTLPEPVKYLWQWFVELHTKDVLTFTEIESWSRLTVKNLTAFETQTLRKLDALYWEIINGRSIKSNHKG